MTILVVRLILRGNRCRGERGLEDVAFITDSVVSDKVIADVAIILSVAGHGLQVALISDSVTDAAIAAALTWASTRQLSTVPMPPLIQSLMLLLLKWLHHQY